MVGKQQKIRGEALQAPCLSEAEWLQFASEELSRYLNDPEALGQHSLVKTCKIDGHPSETDVRPAIAMLLGMPGWIGSDRT